jgi:hypothetical protein
MAKKMPKKLHPLGVLTVAPFRVEVAVFASAEHMYQYHEHVTGARWPNEEASDHTAKGLCLRLANGEGGECYYIVITPKATVYTRIHECSHLLDFVHDAVGVPFGLLNTETRAYGLADVCRQLDEVLD